MLNRKEPDVEDWLPHLVGPADGGAGQIINPWPLINGMLWAAIFALALWALVWAIGRLLGWK